MIIALGLHNILIDLPLWVITGSAYGMSRVVHRAEVYIGLIHVVDHPSIDGQRLTVVVGSLLLLVLHHLLL